MLGPRPEQCFLPLDVGYVCINSHPSALMQWAAFDRDPVAVGALSFHVMWSECQCLIDTGLNKSLDIADLAIFPLSGKVSERVGKGGAGADQFAGQAEHFPEAPVADRQAQIRAVYGNCLLNQVQPGLHQVQRLIRVCPHGSSLAFAGSRRPARA